MLLKICTFRILVDNNIICQIIQWNKKRYLCDWLHADGSQVMHWNGLCAVYCCNASSKIFITINLWCTRVKNDARYSLLIICGMLGCGVSLLSSLCIDEMIWLWFLLARAKICSVYSSILGQWIHPSKHESMEQCCFNVGPASQTVDQH